MLITCMEKAMATHSSTLAWKIPWMEEPGRLQSMGSLGVRHDWATSLSLFTFMCWRRKWHPTPVFLPGESQGRGSLVGCRLWGCRVGHDWSDLAAAADLHLLPRSDCTALQLPKKMHLFDKIKEVTFQTISSKCIWQRDWNFHLKISFDMRKSIFPRNTLVIPLPLFDPDSFLDASEHLCFHNSKEPS